MFGVRVWSLMGSLFPLPGAIPDESKALSLLAPANAVAGMMPGGGLLPTPNPLASVSVRPFFIFLFKWCIAP